MESGHFEKLALRIAKLLKLKILYFRGTTSKPEDVVAYFVDSRHTWFYRNKVQESRDNVVNAEDLCKDLIERYFINCWEKDARWFWREGLGVDDLKSKSFSELEIKLGLRGV